MRIELRYANEVGVELRIAVDRITSRLTLAELDEAIEHYAVPLKVAEVVCLSCSTVGHRRKCC